MISFVKGILESSKTPDQALAVEYLYITQETR